MKPEAELGAWRQLFQGLYRESGGAVSSSVKRDLAERCMALPCLLNLAFLPEVISI
jgi:hypothetical protein